jgi:hypothetical protein
MAFPFLLSPIARAPFCFFQLKAQSSAAQKLALERGSPTMKQMLAALRGKHPRTTICQRLKTFQQRL